MSKELVGENIDGGTLMDPNSTAFQTMLQAAKEKGESNLSIKPDTSTVEDEKGVAKESPSSDSKVDEKAQSTDDDTDDLDTLKNSIRGLKAELSRVRGQRSSSESEASELKERLARMEVVWRKSKVLSNPLQRRIP